MGVNTNFSNSLDTGNHFMLNNINNEITLQSPPRNSAAISRRNLLSILEQAILISYDVQEEIRADSFIHKSK